ncbi:ParB/RepB/Spo0J family partition protein [Rhodococcus rhodnii]|uniref:ParB/RepB/Spo0J family partition protein n=1 Tax=Rhodococcus rhodnii TaxID=38312 RepID=UPI000933D16B|nr:ParB N-terminal domain-containing protein [Rhodococcus rhodnii]
MSTPTQDRRAELVAADPHDIEIGTNVRDHVDLDVTPEFVDSIREHGVLHPVTAHRRDDGVLVLIDGQRRVLAARIAAQSTVPVIVRPDDADTAAEHAIARIGEQVVSNNHRSALTAAQNARAVTEMLDLGVPVATVARTLSVPQKSVALYGAVGRRAHAADALDGSLTLEQAAVLAQFEADGDDEAVRELTTVSPGYFDYTAQRLLQKREELRVRREHFAPLVAAGFTALDARPLYSALVEAAMFRRADDPEQPLDEATLCAAPHLWAVWIDFEYAHFHAKTGEPVDYDDIDEATIEERDLEAAEGTLHADDVREEETAVPVFFFRDITRMDEAGLVASERGKWYVDRALRRAGVDTDNPLPADEDAREAALAERRETERRERARVRILNKKSEAARTLRHEFLARMLAGKTPPRTASVFTARMLAHDASLLSGFHAGDLLPTLLSGGHAAGKELADHAVGVSEQRGWMITFAMVVSAFESHLPKDAWRTRPRLAPIYFEMLAANGHRMTDVEKVISREIDADSVDLDD